jgi:DNA polymerase-3 subunit beta
MPGAAVKIRVERNDLTEAVSWTARTLPNRPTIPVLSGLLLDATEAGMTLAASDLEVSAQAQLDTTVAEPGRVLVPGRLLADITRALPAAPVDLALEGTRLAVRCGSSRFTLPTLPVEDYPDLPAVPPVAGTVAAATFAQAVAQVAIASGKDDTLPVLTGVRFEIEGDRLTMAATDRYRLAVRQLRWRPEDPDTETTALVPARTLSDAAKALVTGGEPVSLHLGAGAAGERLAGFSAGGRRTTTRLVDGEYPKYRSLFPPSAEAVAEIEIAALVESVRRVALVAQRTAPVRLGFTDGELVLEAGTGEDAQASEVLPASFTGEPLTIAFNPTYLLDGLGALEGTIARLSFTSATRPAVLTAVPAEAPADATPGAPADVDDYRYLIMPVRLSG